MDGWIELYTRWEICHKSVMSSMSYLFFIFTSAQYAALFLVKIGFTHVYNMFGKKLKTFYFLFLLVPWQTLLTQYPVSEAANLGLVAFGPKPNHKNMKITHPVVACSPFKSHQCSFWQTCTWEARLDWQKDSLLTPAVHITTSHLAPFGWMK